MQKFKKINSQVSKHSPISGEQLDKHSTLPSFQGYTRLLLLLFSRTPQPGADTRLMQMKCYLTVEVPEKCYGLREVWGSSEFLGFPKRERSLSALSASDTLFSAPSQPLPWLLLLIHAEDSYINVSSPDISHELSPSLTLPLANSYSLTISQLKLCWL